MKQIFRTIGISFIVVGLFLSMIGLIIFGNNIAGSGQRVYNCSVAEISPDFSPAMREECRKLRKQHT